MGGGVDSQKDKSFEESDFEVDQEKVEQMMAQADSDDQMPSARIESFLARGMNMPYPQKQNTNETESSGQWEDFGGEFPTQDYRKPVKPRKKEREEERFRRASKRVKQQQE